MAPPKRPWFRFYVEAIWDVKLRELPVSHRWLWVVVLACARSSPVPGQLLVTESKPMRESTIADAAALSVSQVRSGLRHFAEIGLIERSKDTDAWTIRRWNERQFESDRTLDRPTKDERSDGDKGNDVPVPETEGSIGSEGSSPPTPPPVGGRNGKPKNPRANGTNPRAVANRERAEQLRADIATCGECSDKSWSCLRCIRLENEIRELEAIG